MNVKALSLALIATLSWALSWALSWGSIWQIGAMKPVKGLDVVGPLPAELQLTTHLSAVVGAGATAPDAARALITFFASPEAAAAMRARGPERGGGT